MGHFRQFVKKIDVNPEVFLDVDDHNPLTVLATSSVTPPKRRYQSSPRLSDHGENVISAYFTDRVLKLDLKIERVPGEDQSRILQQLAQLVAHGGVWFRWQDEENRPRFFLTKPADITVVDMILSAKPLRRVTLEIPAEPFSYQLPVTGTIPFTNSPASGVNPMVHVFDTVEGDMPARLVLSWPTPDASHKSVVASCAVFDDTSQTTAYWKSLSAATIAPPPGSGWTLSDVADTSMVAGTRRMLVRASGGSLDLIVPTAATMLQWDDLPPGDYRVFIRTFGIDAGVRLLFWNRPPKTGSALTLEEAVASRTVDAGSAGRDWFDLGVVAMPGGAPLTDVAFGLTDGGGPALWNAGIYFEGSVASFGLDAVMLVPADRPGAITKHGSVTFPSTYTDKIAVWDGQNKARYADGESVLTPGVVSRTAPNGVGGGDPVVVPGAVNVLTFLGTVANPASTSRVDDDKTGVTEVGYLYYPRSLYDTGPPS